MYIRKNTYDNAKSNTSSTRTETVFKMIKVLKLTVHFSPETPSLKRFPRMHRQAFSCHDHIRVFRSHEPDP